MPNPNDFGDALRDPFATDHALPMHDPATVNLLFAQIRDGLSHLMRVQTSQGGDITALVEKVAKIESRDERLSRTEKELAELKAVVLVLTTDKNRRDGAAGLVTWVLKNWPGVLGFIAMGALVLKAGGKI